MVFVWAFEINLISMLGIKIDLMSAAGSELTWFLCCVVEIDKVFVSRHRKFHFVVVSESNLTRLLCA